MGPLKISCLVLLSVILITSNFATAKSVSEGITAHLENLRKQMSCGFPDLDIPPLAPLLPDDIHWQQKFYGLSLSASLLRSAVNGLNGFEINYLKANILNLEGKLEITFPNLLADSDYALKLSILRIAKFTRTGDVKFNLKNFKLKANIKLGSKNTRLFVKSLDTELILSDVKFDVSGLFGNQVIQNALSKAIETFIMVLVKSQKLYMTQIINDAVIPQIDNYLNGLTVKDILDIINSPVEPSSCELLKVGFYNFSEGSLLQSVERFK